MKTADRKNLPDPDCTYGYTEAQIEDIMGSRLEEFNKWMAGQTMAICEGREYNHSKGEYVATGHSHGVIVYVGDVMNFLRGFPVLD